MKDRFCITQVAATAETLLGIAPDAAMAPPLTPVLRSAGRRLTGPCDRVFLYNPDAIAQWLYAAYRSRFAPLEARADLGLGMGSVYPPVTPACFASMYSGLQPKEHGIQSYINPVLAVDTVFDHLPRAGRRCAIVSTEGDSISLIFLGRDVDYYIFPTVAQCNRKALELIREDRHHLVVLYNGNYDHWMHRGGPESPWALREPPQKAQVAHWRLWVEVRIAILSLQFYRLNRILETGSCPHKKPLIQRNGHALLIPVAQDELEHHPPEGADGLFHKWLQGCVLSAGHADKVLRVV